MKNQLEYGQIIGINKSENSFGDIDLQSPPLMRLFIDEIKQMYWAEEELVKAIPKMIGMATSENLIVSLTNHLEETKFHFERLEEIFEMLDEKPVAVKCETMDDLLKEAEYTMVASEQGATRNSGIISAAQKVEHYEIATYAMLSQYAKTLGLVEVTDMLEQTLEEEKAAEKKLVEIAKSSINIPAVN